MIVSKPALFLFFGSLLLNILAFSLVAGISNEKDLRFPYLTGDSNHYRILAEHILSKKAFDTFPDRTSPDSFRTPGYPLFLAGLYALGGSWKAAALLQAIAVSGIGVLVYLLGKEMFGERVGMFAGILAILDPINLFYSTLTLSDSFFTLLFLASLIALIWSSQGNKWAFLSGAILGYAVLVRPIGQFLPVLFLGYLWFSLQDRRLLIRRAGIFLIGFFIIVFSWMLRNKIIFDSWQLSSVGNFNAGYFSMLFLEQQTGIPAGEYERRLVNEKAGGDPMVLRTLYGGPISLGFAKEVISTDPLSYMGFHIVKTMPFFLNDGLREIARLLEFSDATLPNLSGFLLSGDFSELALAVTKGDMNTLLFFIGTGTMAIFLIFAGYGIWHGALNARLRLFSLLILLSVLYFALLTGPVANARYRMPAMPLIIISAVFGAHVILSQRKENSRGDA